MSSPLPNAAAAAHPPRAENLALIFQEVFTVIERLRANRQRVNDAETFRTQIRTALKAAEQEALRRGYNLEDVRVAVFAAVAFLDESILNMQSAVFGDWARKPLQEELFGVQLAGEIFFRNLDRLLGRPDSDPLADILEVHQLCLLLGFRGRLSASGMAEVRSIVAQIEAKVRRIRGALGPLSPPWEQAAAGISRPRDGLLGALRWTAIACWAIAVGLFVAFLLTLSAGEGTLQSIASRIGL
ncbi:MAG TPA: DotU family type IV/VI secretion system protein [Bryobacteraceae bacterium]|nr:DotU family type IV/VI secretion system protein [Bryobacteraceae bacterium]